MPMLEIIVARAEPLKLEQKRAFAREAVEIFRTVLGTPPGRLRLAFYELRPEDSLGLLEEPDPAPQPTSDG
uniref:4-oxalocrotonate tautomerase n=1 Tax=Thermomicrobium roseum TaxID=500 RepID=A0A7C5VVP6_THERO